jgi:chaperonin cofactor prefoldin
MINIQDLRKAVETDPEVAEAVGYYLVSQHNAMNEKGVKEAEEGLISRIKFIITKQTKILARHIADIQMEDEHEDIRFI